MSDAPNDYSPSPSRYSTTAVASSYGAAVRPPSSIHHIANKGVIAASAVVTALGVYYFGEAKDLLILAPTGTLVLINHFQRQGGFVAGTPLFSQENVTDFFRYSAVGIVGNRAFDLVSSGLDWAMKNNYLNGPSHPIPTYLGTVGLTYLLTMPPILRNIGSTGRALLVAASAVGAGIIAYNGAHNVQPFFSQFVSPDNIVEKWKLASGLLGGMFAGVIARTAAHPSRLYTTQERNDRRQERILKLQEKALRRADPSAGPAAAPRRSFRGLLVGGVLAVAAAAAVGFVERDKIMNSDFAKVIRDSGNDDTSSRPACDLPLTPGASDCTVVVQDAKGAKVSTGLRRTDVAPLPAGTVTIEGPVPNDPRTNMRVTVGKDGGGVITGIIPFNQLRAATLAR